MLKRPDPRRKDPKKPLQLDPRGGGGGGGGARILHDLEALGRALAASRKKPTLDRDRPRSASTGKSPQPIPQKDRNAPSLPQQPSSIWKWKPLKALSHIRRRRFLCRFTVRVHSVRGLAPAFEGQCIFVQWRRAGDGGGGGGGGARTKAVMVIGGTARFDEAAAHLFFVYGSRGGHGGSARYEERQFVLCPLVVGAPQVDLGRHRFDITRLLPLEMEEMEREGCSGEWTTGLKLSGKGKGAVLSVSFGFSVLKGGVEELGREKDAILEGSGAKGSPRNSVDGGGGYGSAKDVKSTPEVSPRCRGSGILGTQEVRLLSAAPKDAKGELEVDKLPPEIKHSASMAPDNAKVEEKVVKEETLERMGYPSEEENVLASDSMVEELAAAFDSLSIGLDVKADGYTKARSSYKIGRITKSKSLSLDDLTDSVSSEFLKMIGTERNSPDPSSDSELDSPRERLWRQFKRESLGSCFVESPKESLGHCGEQRPPSPGPRLEVGSDSGDGLDLSSLVEAAETEHQKATQAMKAKARAKLLEDAEAEALMREWGMDEKAFAKSPPPSGGCSGFGSPIELPPEDPPVLPPLGEGLGPFLQTKDGGYLRTMSPSLFKSAKSNGSLVMQVSRLVVVPAEMGSGIADILQGLASLGVEKLSMQARKLMPLEDITGKMMQQVAWEALSAREPNERPDCFQAEDSVLPGKALGDGRVRGRKKSWSSIKTGDGNSEFVSLEELAPFAMDKIEALSLEGLRIQSGLADEDAPSSASSKSCCERSNVERNWELNSRALGLEGAAGLQLLDVDQSMDEVDGLMGLSITLDEWMRLDSGEVDEEDLNNERTCKILAAHHANSAGLVSGGSWRDIKGCKGRSKKCGLLGNNFIVALMVQLHDPMRNYEPVGTPMLTLIQVERIFAPPKPRVYRKVSDRGNGEEYDEDVETVTNSEEVIKKREEPTSQFTVTEVHVAGLKTEPDKKKLWGNPMQQTSGSRWLLANGMGKNNKHPFMKSKAVSKASPSTTTVQPGDTLWSISSRAHGKGDK